MTDPLSPRNAAARTKAPDAFATAPRTGPGVTEKLQLNIGGLSCSFCAASITKAMNRMEGVRQSSVDLAHEEALIEYAPAKVDPDRLKDTILELGYTIRDANKVRTFEEDAAELRRERNNLLVSGALAVIAFVFMVLMWTDAVYMGTIWPWIVWLMPTLVLARREAPGGGRAAQGTRELPERARGTRPARSRTATPSRRRAGVRDRRGRSATPHRDRRGASRAPPPQTRTHR